MSERRYTDDEVHAIFQRAAVRQEEARTAEDASRAGLTLNELQEIGRASGIDPAHIAAAAMEVRKPAEAEPSASATSLGMPTALRAERLIPHAVPDEAWERIVPELRRIFGTDGIGGDVGRVREWTMRQSRGRHDRAVKVTLTPEGDSTRVTIDQSLRGAVLGLSISAGIYVLVAGLMAVLSLMDSSGGEPPFIVAAIFLALALALFGGLQIGTRLYARHQDARFAQVLDRIELLARDAASPVGTPTASHEEAPHREAPRLDLDALPDAPGASDASTTRTRTQE